MKPSVPFRGGWFGASLALGLILLGITGQEAKADVACGVSDSTTGDSALVTFQAVSGGINVIVTNTETLTGTLDISHAISQVQFTVGGGLGLPSSFDSLTAAKITYSGTVGTVGPTTTYSPPSMDPNLHWEFSTPAANSVGLATVAGGPLGLPALGGGPHELIVQPNSAGNPSLSADSHNPSFNGTATFFLADSTVPPNLTAANITGVSVAFGTGPETTLETTVIASVVPEPSTLAIAGLGGLGFVGYGLRRRLKK